VVQASAADWALVLLATLRTALAGLAGQADVDHRAHLVFFQHDEVVVHCPVDRADEVVAAIEAAATAATRLVFGATEVSFPMSISVVSCYADAK
jgi:DNA polymerase-1